MNDSNSTFRKCFLFLLLLPAFLNAQKPEFSMKELVAFTSIPAGKFDSYISRKGYKPQAENTETDFGNFYKVSKDKSIHKLLGRYDKSDTSALFFQTNSIEEFNELKTELIENGFINSSYDSVKALFPKVYQRANVRVYPSVKEVDGSTIYSFQVERKELPHSADIVFAEDLMKLVSHEYLATVFGPSNVKKDIFYFSEKEVNHCSVLFPNTNLQVIFIWKDEENHEDLSFMLLGGHLNTKGAQGFNRAIEMNKWRSQQGVYLGMSLRDLEKLNGAPILFYGWESEQPGMISPKTTGNINFKKLGIQLNCLDCNEDKYYSKSQLLSSSDVLQQNGRVYVSTLVLVPKQ